MEKIQAKALSMHEAAAHLARITGTPRPHRGTLIRWATKGVRNCRLRAEPVAGRWYTTAEAIEEFLRQVTQTGAAASGGSVAPGPVRAAQVQRVVAELDTIIAPKRGRKGGAS
jgi:hypothetical protein